MPGDRVRIEAQCLPGFGDASLELPNPQVAVREVAEPPMIARVRPLHELLNFNCLIYFPGDLGVVERRDAELLIFTHPVLQCKSLGRIFCPQSWLIAIAVLYCQSDVGESEVRI